MDPQRESIRHVLAALAYRTQKALRGADDRFPDFPAGNGSRTPRETLCHMGTVLGYGRTFFVGGFYQSAPLESFAAEVERFHEIVADLSAHLAAGTPIREITLMQLLQGPICDAMTHAGQLSLLRRLAGSPVPPENFIFADISADRLGSDQPLPAAPDLVWVGKIIHFGWRLRRLLKGRDASKK
jgi:hypothetical protein